ncbi:hypothetical protein TcCL_ESM09361 [Trypanosoma cruzi]|nr:hypothetical protein TcCL_ESM09361 [Trypanosoma cruzi]
MRVQATGAGRTLSVSRAEKVKEHQCRIAAARTVVPLLSSLVFFQLHGPCCGNACPRTSKYCNLLWHNAAGPDAGRCRQPCANNDPVRETLLAPGLPDNTGC